MSWTSLIGPLLTAGTSIYGAMQANRAGERQANAARDAAAAQQATAGNQLSMLAPWRQAGERGLNLFADQVAQPFQQSPGYQFAYDEAMRGVMQNQAARGLVGSGSTLRALQDRGAGLASQEYGNYMNRLAALSGLGQTAAGQGAGFMGQGTAAANNFLTAGAGAQASGQVQGANALMGGANNLLTYFMQNQPSRPAKPGQGYVE